MVCVLGFAAGVHFFEPFYDPALSDDASDRSCITGIYCDKYCTSFAFALVQRNFPANGHQSQPQREITAGKPASFPAAATL